MATKTKKTIASPNRHRIRLGGRGLILLAGLLLAGMLACTACQPSSGGSATDTQGQSGTEKGEESTTVAPGAHESASESERISSPAAGDDSGTDESSEAPESQPSDRETLYVDENGEVHLPFIPVPNPK